MASEAVGSGSIPLGTTSQISLNCYPREPARGAGWKSQHGIRMISCSRLIPFEGRISEVPVVVELTRL